MLRSPAHGPASEPALGVQNTAMEMSFCGVLDYTLGLIVDYVWPLLERLVCHTPFKLNTQLVLPRKLDPSNAQLDHTQVAARGSILFPSSYKSTKAIVRRLVFLKSCFLVGKFSEKIWK